MFGHSVRTSFYYISVGLSEPSITTVFVESIGSLSKSADFNQKLLDKAMNLDALAERFHISKQWLISQFKKYTNSTPMEYLYTMRIQQWKNCLRTAP